MGTQDLQGFLFLLFLPLLQPRGASAGSLHSPGKYGHGPDLGLLFLGWWDPHHLPPTRSNPDGDVQPWCYVAETEEGIYWRYCDIPTCHMPGYLGCFVDSGAPPALSGPSGTSTKLTVQVCLRFCRMKGYQLAGVEAGYACFCGSESDLARGRLAPATDCDQICFGHPGQLCGGDGRLGVYEVSVGSCQGNWTAPQGVIYSPDFPDEYGPDRNCSWALGPPGAALELTFRLFELADPRDRLEPVSYTHLDVYKSPVLGGASRPPTGGGRDPRGGTQGGMRGGQEIARGIAGRAGRCSGIGRARLMSAPSLGAVCWLREKGPRRWGLPGAPGEAGLCGTDSPEGCPCPAPPGTPRLRVLLRATGL
uniref:Kringle-containing protein marking the eye and the nose n=1 Tax=Mandrillus leucophaeus TaxID=9568 RepID=A0A2K5YWX9_MANLE